MRPFFAKLSRRLAAINLISSNFAIGTASAFVLATAAASLVVDRPEPSGGFAGSWVLRGALAPGETVPTVAPAHAATQKVPRLG